MTVPLSSTLPQRPLPVLDPDGTFTLPWYRKLQQLDAGTSNGLTPAQVDALIAAALVPVEAEIADAIAIANEALAEAGGLSVLNLLALAELDGAGG